MSTEKPQPKATSTAPDRRDDLALEAETVKDLEPRENAGGVHGGQMPASKYGDVAMGRSTSGI